MNSRFSGAWPFDAPPPRGASKGLRALSSLVRHYPRKKNFQKNTEVKLVISPIPSIGHPFHKTTLPVREMPDWNLTHRCWNFAQRCLTASRCDATSIPWELRSFHTHQSPSAADEGTITQSHFCATWKMLTRKTSYAPQNCSVDSSMHGHPTLLLVGARTWNHRSRHAQLGRSWVFSTISPSWVRGLFRVVPVHQVGIQKV